MSRDWKFVKLKDVCQVVTGSTPKTNIPEYWDGEYPWVTPAELKGDKYIKDTERHITDEAVAHTNLTLMPIGTVLLSSRAPIGKVAITETEMYCNQGFKNLICSDKIDNQYLYLWLSSQTEYLNSLGRGATFKEISKTIVENIEVPLTSIEKQHKIVAELEQIKSLLSLKRKELEIYDKLAQSLFYEMFGDPVENEKGWEVRKLGDLCLIERGGSPRPISDFITESEDGLNWIKIGDASEGSMYINSTKEKIKKEGLKKTRMVYKGDFILSNSMSFGRPYILGIDGCIHDGWLVIHDENNIFDKVYLYHALSHPSMYAQFTRMAVGGVVNNLNSNMVRKVSVVVPPMEKQRAFAKRIELIEAQKERVKNAIDKLQVLLNNRMDYWFVIQPVAEQIVENAMTEDNIKEIYDEYKQGKDIQDGTIHYDNGHPRGCTDNNMDFRLLADLYNYMKDSGETSVEAIEARYSYTSHAKHCVFELKELGLLTSDDLKNFYIV